MSQRAEQAAGLIRDAVQKIITTYIHDPRVRGLVTVTRVTVSDDLRGATVYVSVMPEKHRDLTLHGLQAAAKHIRHRVSDQLALRTIPDLAFKPDKAAARQAQVLDAIAQVAREREDTESDPDARVESWGAEFAPPAPEPIGGTDPTSLEPDTDAAASEGKEQAKPGRSEEGAP